MISASSTPIRYAQKGAAGFVPELKVYEDIPVEPAHWEYRVVTVDTNSRALPDEARLNEMGNEGWFLVGIVNQGRTVEEAPIHYYFVRQRAK